MSTTDATDSELTDPELISRVREGDIGAYGTLFARHVDAATRLARMLVGGPDADDLVSEAFVKVLNVLLAGGGPDVAFRAYLLTSVRRLHIDKVRGQQKLTTSGDMEAYDPGVPFTDTAVAGFEGGAAAKAFASLPERWQMVLWHLEVENQKPADIAVLLGMSANSVSALAYRAREGLRQAFLNMHMADLVSEECKDTNDLMGGYVRHALSRRDTAKVEDHLDHCRRCTAVYLELSEVNSSLAGLLGPALLGAAAAGYLGGGAAVGAGVGAGAGAATVMGRIRDVALAHLPVTAAATATAVGIGAIAGIAIVNRGPTGNERAASAEPPGIAGLAPSSTPTPSDGSSARVKPLVPKPTATATAAEGPTEPAPITTTTDAPTGTSTTDEGTTNPGDGDGQGGSGNGNGNGGTKPGGGIEPTNPATPTPTEPTPTEPTPTEPTPTEPTPTEPTPTEPTPTEPPANNVDMALDLAGTYFQGGNFHVRVRVTGTPQGETVQVRASTSNGGLHSHNGATCHRSGTSYDCTVSGDRILVFGVHNRSRPTLTFTVSPPPGWTDSNPGNNSRSIETPSSSGDGET